MVETLSAFRLPKQALRDAAAATRTPEHGSVNRRHAIFESRGRWTANQVQLSTTWLHPREQLAGEPDLPLGNRWSMQGSLRFIAGRLQG